MRENTQRVNAKNINHKLWLNLIYIQEEQLAATIKKIKAFTMLAGRNQFDIL